MDKAIFDSVKRALWEFFCSCVKGNPSNPKDQGYRKNLTTKEEKIIYAAKAKMPNLQKILTLAIDSVQSETPEILKPEYIKQHFSECVVSLERRAFNIYLKNEESLFLSIIDEWVSQNEELIEKINKGSPTPTDFTKEVCKYFYPMVQRMEFDSSQTRKARGGKTFEHIVEYLLRRIEVPCQRPSKEARKILKRVDLVVPDQETAIKRPDSAFFLSCKRTLRERWKQAIPERKPSWRVFLLTIDEILPEDKAMEIDTLGMIVYVRDELKDKSHLQKKEWVRRLSELPKDIIGGIN
jgi:hypothetical protein